MCVGTGNEGTWVYLCELKSFSFVIQLNNLEYCAKGAKKIRTSPVDYGSVFSVFGCIKFVDVCVRCALYFFFSVDAVSVRCQFLCSHVQRVHRALHLLLCRRAYASLFAMH